MGIDMNETIKIFQYHTMVLGILGLMGIAAWIAVARFGIHRGAARLMNALSSHRKNRCVRLVENWLMFAFLGAAIVYAAWKPPKDLQITWDNGLSDNGSFYTNAIPGMIYYDDARYLTVKWTKAAFIPDMATFKFWYGLKDTEDEMQLLFECSVTNLEMTVEMTAHPTNWVYYAENYYVPDIPIRTNGVYHIDAISTKDATEAISSKEANAVPLGTQIYGDSTRIVPPEGTPGEFIQKEIDKMNEPQSGRSIESTEPIE